MRPLLIGLIVTQCALFAASLMGVFVAGAMIWLVEMVLSPIGIAVAVIALDLLKEPRR